MTDPDLASMLDVRTVTIMWVGDDDYPIVSFDGCSSYEAEGLLGTALRHVADLNTIPTEDDEDE